MATWQDVINNPEFAKETPERQMEIRDRFFEKIIRPQVEANGDDLATVQARFNEKYNYTAQQEAQPNPSLYQTEYDADGDVQPVVGQPQPQPVPRSRADRGRRRSPQQSNVSEYDSVDFNLDFNKSWEDTLSSAEFRNLPPMDKRRVADEYFNQVYAPSMTPEEAEAERERFRKSSGLANMVNQEKSATDSRGFFDEAGEYLEKTSLKDMGYDLGNTISRMGDAVGKGIDYLVETPKMEIASDAVNLGKKVASSLYDVATDVAEYGYDEVFGMSDEEFIQRYGVSKAEYTDSIGSVERFQLKRKLDAIDNKNIDNALKDRVVATQDIDTAKVRSEANQKATDVVTEGVIDVASMIPAVRMARTGVAASRLAKLGTVAKDTAAVGAGEVAKNVYHGRPLDENVLTSMAINAGVSTPLALRDPTNQATKAIHSVGEGKRVFDEVMSDLSKSENLTSAKDKLRKGESFNLRDYDQLKNVDETTYSALSKVDKLFDEGLKVEGFKVLDEVFDAKKSPTEFSKSASQALRKEGIPFRKDNLQAYFDARSGKFDDSIEVSRSNIRTQATDTLENDGFVGNYMAAMELDAMKGLKGYLGKKAYDVSSTEGINFVQRGLGKVAEATSLGFGKMARSSARDAARKSMVKEAQEVLQREVMNSRNSRVRNSGRIAELENVEAKVNEVRTSEELLDLIRNDPQVAREFKDVGLLDGFSKVDQYEMLLEDAAVAPVGPVKPKSPYRNLLDKSEPEIPLGERGITAQDRMALNLYDEALEEPMKQAYKDKATDLRAGTALDAVEGKSSLSTKELMSLASTSEMLANPWKRKVSPTTDDILSQSADRSRSAEFNQALAVLHSAGKGVSETPYIRRVLTTAMLYTFAAPVTYLQAGLQVLNGMSQSRQKRGLTASFKLMKKHYPEIRKTNLDFNKAYFNSVGEVFDSSKLFEYEGWVKEYASIHGKAEGAAFDKASAEIKKTYKAFEDAQTAMAKDVDKVGKGKFIRTLSLLEEAVRLSERVEEEEEEE